MVMVMAVPMVVFMIVRMVVVMPVVMVMTMRVFMPVRMWVIVVVWMVVIMCVRLGMAVHVAIFVGMPFTRVRLAMGSGVFIKNQRLDRHGHGPGGHANATEVHKVKAPQSDAIDDQDFALHALVFFQQMAQVVRNVAIRHHINGSLLSQ